MVGFCDFGSINWSIGRLRVLRMALVREFCSGGDCAAVLHGIND